MKISKYNFLKLIVKHFSLKLGREVSSETELSLLVNSLIPAFNNYVPHMKRNNIITESEEINIDKLSDALDQFFTTVPILNIPFGGLTISITKKDIEVFLKDLRKHGIIDEVIYLSCH